ncbi:ATP-binding protein [Xanthobacter autotrophicus]|uniref:sensor histidine kinase n=1 Tax=Xanthobacter autotrophicus TaxID=280 RepID=UPI00372B91EC
MSAPSEPAPGTRPEHRGRDSTRERGADRSWPRFGIAARIAVIVVGALLAVQVLMLVAYITERRSSAPLGPFVPMLQRVAALAQLLGEVSPSQRELALRATTASGFVPAYVLEHPQVKTPAYLGFAATRVRQLMGGAPDRFVALALIGSEAVGLGKVERLRDLRGARLRLVVGLDGGGYLDVLAGGDLTVRLLGVPVGLVAGILGFLVALAALFAVRRETRPLSDLADVVERFGARLEPLEVPERGAPDVRLVIRAVNAMQARIAELVRMRTLVLGAISHDLRTYLTRLRLRLELLPPGPQVDKAQADLTGMQALVDDALAFARATFAPASGERVDLSALARAEYEAHLAEGAAVSLAGADAPLLVDGARGALARVLANLVGNALAYGQRADITLLDLGGQVELRVDDRGPGIPAAERASVFEPFYRVEPSRNRESGGAGLGLTIVQQIVEGHGGEVVIADRPGGGARLRVLLPKAGADQPASAASTPAATAKRD